MSIIKNAKEFFGLTPADDLAAGHDIHDDAYYGDEPRYETAGSAAYAPRPYETHGYGHSSRQDRQVAIAAVELTSYLEAAEVGAPFREGDAVVFDLTAVDSADAKRVVDFAAGLCYALEGKMEKLDSRVFALIPQGAAVTRADLERAARLR